ncbi:MAG: hemerythrin domain-containing protein [Pseudonocardiaceae bacterium]
MSPGERPEARRQTNSSAGAGAHAHTTLEMDMTETRTDLDVVDVLMTDHQEVLDLIQQIKTTENPEQRRDLADIVITELVRHSVSEEMYVYPEMREHLPNGEEAVKHDTDEHKKLEQIMKDLEGVDATDRRFDELVGALEATLRDQVHDEETQHSRSCAPAPRARTSSSYGTRCRRPRSWHRPGPILTPRTTSFSTRSSDRVPGWWTDCETGSPAGRRAYRPGDRPGAAPTEASKKRHRRER